MHNKKTAPMFSKSLTMQGHFKIQKSPITACLSLVLVCTNVLVGGTVARAGPPVTVSENTPPAKTTQATTPSAAVTPARAAALKAHAARLAKLRELRKQAVVCQKAKDIHGLLRVCNEVLAIEPDSYNWLFMRAGAYWYLRKRDLAIEDYSACIKQKPTAQLYEIRSGQYKLMNNSQAALNDIQEAIKLKPMARFVLKEAQLLLEVGDIDGGIAAAKRVPTLLETAPAGKRLTFEIESYKIMGLAYLQKNDPKSALAPLSKALDLTPGWTAASKKNDRATLLKLAKWNGDKILCRGEAYEKLGKLKEAISDYELTVAAYPKDFDYRRSLLRAYRKSGQYEKALALVNQLLLEDDAPDLYYKRAEIYKKLGKTAQAKTDLDRAGNIEYSLMGSHKKLAR